MDLVTIRAASRDTILSVIYGISSIWYISGMMVMSVILVMLVSMVLQVIRDIRGMGCFRFGTPCLIIDLIPQINYP